jgi:hypothetical protein
VDRDSKRNEKWNLKTESVVKRKGIFKRKLRFEIRVWNVQRLWKHGKWIKKEVEKRAKSKILKLSRKEKSCEKHKEWIRYY